MPLQDPFALRIAKLRVFLREPTFRVLLLHRPSDLRRIARRLLVNLQDEPDSLHAMLHVEQAFRDYLSFFESVVEEVSASVDAVRDELLELGVEVPAPPSLHFGSDRESGAVEPREMASRTAGYLSAVADAMPPETGSLTILLEPEEIGSRDALAWALRALARHTESGRAKVVVLDHGEPPLLPEGDVEQRVLHVDFAVPPQELEKTVVSDLEAGQLSPSEVRRFGLLAGAFATSAGRFREAEGRLLDCVRRCREAEVEGEEANALFNLGNLYLREERFEEASENFGRAAGISLDEEQHGMAAMALTNLGVSLHREGRGAEAMDSFGSAQALFAAIDHRPGQAHVADCIGSAYALGGDSERARQFWQEAAAIYASITAPHLAQVRSSGREEMLRKIARLGADEA